MTALADLAMVDEEGALRHRCGQVDDKFDLLKHTLKKVGWDWGDFRDMCDVSNLFHENGLEGVVLTFPEIKSVVDSKVVSDVALLPMYQHIKDQKRCIDETRALAMNPKGTVKLDWVKKLHGVLIQNEELAGDYRKDIPIHRTYFHEIALPENIDAGLKDALDYLRRAKVSEDLHPISLAANVHHRFMAVFPFSKYSGMIGRLLMNFVLERNDYLPAIVHQTERQKYYEALKGSERDFRYFLCDVLEHAMNNALRFFERQQISA